MWFLILINFQKCTPYIIWYFHWPLVYTYYYYYYLGNVFQSYTPTFLTVYEVFHSPKFVFSRMWKILTLWKVISKSPSVQWLLRRRVSIIQTDVSDGMVYLMKLKQTMKMAQGTLEGAAQNFERLSVWKIECQNSKRDCIFLLIGIPIQFSITTEWKNISF